MEATLHRFVRLLRLGGLRVSIPEALDAMWCAAQPGVLSSRAVLWTALRVAVVKDQRGQPTFDEIFDAFFSLVRQTGVENVLDIMRGGVDSALLGLGHSSVQDLGPTDLVVSEGFWRDLGVSD